MQMCCIEPHLASSVTGMLRLRIPELVRAVPAYRLSATNIHRFPTPSQIQRLETCDTALQLRTTIESFSVCVPVYLLTGLDPF